MTLTITGAETPEAGVSYETEDCFDTGSDGDTLDTLAAWTLGAGDTATAEMDDATNNDAGGCTSGSMALLLDVTSGTPRIYTRVAAPTGTFTLSFVYEKSSEAQDNKDALLIRVLDSSDNIIWGTKRYTNTAGDDDFYLYYDSNNDDDCDTYVEVCAACLADSGTTAVEIETNPTTDKVTAIWIGGTEYNNGAAGWNVGHYTMGKIWIRPFATVAGNDSWIDSLRTYEGSRNASY
jgi:hypothetical protein